MIKGTIVSLREDGKATIEAFLPVAQIVHRKVKEVYIEPIDSRPLSGEQRRMCYALIKSIADWSGSSAEEVKTALKLQFWAEQVETLADKIFSLANAPMSLVAAFQKFLIEFILSNDVPVKHPLLDCVDDIEHYTYMCLVHKKCAVCGKRADLHHVDAIGMGNDRNKVEHLGREVMSLCRDHHTEIHTLGRRDFLQKYHLNGGIVADRTVLKIYGLRR